MSLHVPYGASLILASHNKGKLAEIRDLLEPFALDIGGAGEWGLPEPEETEDSFAGNAALKARAAADAAGQYALSDDSGLVVDALNGAPGIHSARWAGDARDFSAAMARIERELQTRGATDFSARFVCALALAAPPAHEQGGGTEIFQGEIAGRLVFPPRGANGFGYDPIFIAEGHDITFGEMAPWAKHAISHRARAFEKLLASGALPRKSG